MSGDESKFGAIIWLMSFLTLCTCEGTHMADSLKISSTSSDPGVVVAAPNTIFVHIDGRIIPPINAPSDWFTHTRVHLDGGRQHVGFVRPDGNFRVSAVSSGSYLVEVINPVFVFQAVRIDVNSKGKIRARRFNALQPNSVKVITYPLEMSSVGKASYFYPREQLRTLDLLMNPTLLFMVVPFLLIMVLPKMFDADDPEIQREMQNFSALNPRQNLPDMSEMLSSMSLLGSGGNKAGGQGNERGTGSRANKGAAIDRQAASSAPSEGRNKNAVPGSMRYSTSDYSAKSGGALYYPVSNANKHPESSGTTATGRCYANSSGKKNARA